MLYCKFYGAWAGFDPTAGLTGDDTSPDVSCAGCCASRQRRSKRIVGVSTDRRSC